MIWPNESFDTTENYLESARGSTYRGTSRCKGSWWPHLPREYRVGGLV